MNDISIGNVLLGSLGTLFASALAYFGIVRKSKSDEVVVALAAWKELIDPLKEELAETKQELRETRAQLLELQIALTQAEALHAKESNKLKSRIRELETINLNRA